MDLVIGIVVVAAIKDVSCSIAVSCCNFRKMPDPNYSMEKRWFPQISDPSCNCKNLQLLKRRASSGCLSYDKNFYKNPHKDACIKDTTPPTPVFSGCPSADIIATDPMVNYPIPAAIDADTAESLPVSCSPSSGTMFTENSTVVTCTASDAVGNVASIECIFNIQLACRDPLGMENGGIPDSSLASSSIGNDGYHKEKARLNTHSAWCANVVDLNQWIRVDLQTTVSITGLITQGRHNSNVWTTTYNLQYSDNGFDWYYMTGTDASPIEFQANEDDDTQMTAYLPAVLQTRFIQIRPVTWESSICIRFELLGC